MSLYGVIHKTRDVFFPLITTPTHVERCDVDFIYPIQNNVTNSPPLFILSNQDPNFETIYKI